MSFCMSAASRRALATAGGASLASSLLTVATFVRRLVLELVGGVARRSRASAARSARSLAMRRTTARLSNSPPWLLRASDASMICSRNGAVLQTSQGAAAASCSAAG